MRDLVGRVLDCSEKGYKTTPESCRPARDTIYPSVSLEQLLLRMRISTSTNLPPHHEQIFR